MPAGLEHVEVDVHAVRHGAALPAKCATETNDADIFTKPLTGAAFARAQSSIMGHDGHGGK
jgi:hypothetical protein